MFLEWWKLRVAGVYAFATLALLWLFATWPDDDTITVIAISWGLWLGTIGYNCWEVIHAHRRDRRDRVDTGPDLTAGYTPFYYALTPGGTSTGAGTGESPRLVEEPIKAWKHAGIVHESYGWRFSGIAYPGSRYGVEAVAHCETARLGGTEPHPAPKEGCTCGFYALKDRPVEVEYGSVVLEVELYGKVLVGEFGYRAEKQRVLAVYAKRRPFARCDSPNLNPNGYGRWDCGRPAAFLLDGRPTCAQHALDANRRYTEAPVEVPDLATEWHWVT